MIAAVLHVSWTDSGDKAIVPVETNLTMFPNMHTTMLLWQ
jgi:hypothetical protein